MRQTVAAEPVAIKYCQQDCSHNIPSIHTKTGQESDVLWTIGLKFPSNYQQSYPLSCINEKKKK